jgi:methylenetetrahydrofolate reductase (NADPH)
VTEKDQVPLKSHSPSLLFYFFVPGLLLSSFSDFLLYPHETLMKISQKIDQSLKDDKVWWSFEYFPPRTAQVSFFQYQLGRIYGDTRKGFTKSARSYRAYEGSWARIHRHHMVSGLIFLYSTCANNEYRNAGGRTSDLTSEMVKTCQGLIGLETCMHLTCTNMPKKKVDIALGVILIAFLIC